MPGFSVEIDFKISYHKDQRFIASSEQKNIFCYGDSCILYYFPLSKFENDKIFFENDEYLIILDGVVLNKSSLLLESTALTWIEYVLNELSQGNTKFYNTFRGSFCGFVFNKLNNEWVIFNDQIGSKQIFYSSLNDKIIISTDIDHLYLLLEKNNVKKTLNKDAAYMLLSYGYMLEDVTICCEINRLIPGSYIAIKVEHVQITQYFNFDYEQKIDLNENLIIEKIDEYFRNAVSLQFEKDKEYSYSHFVALSAGLDSRMTSWVAHELGYNNQINFTFSQSNYLDETIPKRIASDLGHEWIFKSLDNGNMLYHVDEITKFSGGNVLYYGLAHSYSLYKYVNFYNIGIIHSGQLGDVVIGTFVKNKKINKFNIQDGAYSNTYLERFKNYKLKYTYPNSEMFRIYQRGFNGANSGLLVTQHYSETLSPFLNIDFIQFMLSIPLEYRINHNIYKKWVLKKYPKAANYIWEKINAKISEPVVKIFSRDIPISQIIPKILNRIGFENVGLETKNSMNPIGYWLKKNSCLLKFLDEYFNNYINLIENEELKLNLQYLYLNGTSVQKVQVISLLSACKIYQLR